MKRAAGLCLVLACGARTELGGDYLPSGNDADGNQGDTGLTNDGGPPPKPCLVTTPTLLALGGKEIQFITLDAANVYWTDFARGTVSAVPKGGGPSRVLASQRGSPAGVVASSGTVYWAEFSADAIASVDSAGNVMTIAENQQGAYDMAAVGDAVYWTTVSGCTVARLKPGGSPQVLVHAKQPYTSIVSTGSLVFWISLSQKSVERYDVTTSAVTTLLNDGPDPPFALATDGANVYFGGTSPERVTIGAVPKDGGSTTTLYDAACPVDAGIASGCLADLTTNGTFVYFTAAGGLVQKVPVSGGTATLVADHQARPLSIAVDDTCVYWSNLGDGTIWAAPK